MIIQTDLRVGQVTVVQQDQITAGMFDEGGNRGALVMDVNVEAFSPDELAFGQCVDADAQTMGPQGGVLLDRRLDDVEAGEVAVLVDIVVRTDGVDPWDAQPLLGEGRQIASRRHLELMEEILELSVREGVLGEIRAHTGQELGLSNEGNQLLQGGGTFGVGDAVEVLLDGVEIDHVSGDRMGSRQLVLGVTPRLALVREGDPWVNAAVLLGDLLLAVMRRPLGEGLVEPEVVPPLHGDEIAEPHVSELVKDGVVAVLVGGRGDAGTEQQVVTVGDAGGVLHGSGVEFRHEGLGVLAEWVRVAEFGLVNLKSTLCGGADSVGVEVFLHRLTAQNVGVHFARQCVNGSVIDVVLAGDKGCQICRNWKGGLKRPP